MADNKYSLDEILNEYHSSGSGGDKNTPDLDDILNSYPATKNFEDSGLAEIFDSRKSTTDIDLSGINISLQSDYPTPEEIKNAKDEEQLSEEDRIKKKKQIDYEIMSGDYDHKYLPDELKTSADIKAEQEKKAAEDKKAAKAEKAEKKKKNKPNWKKSIFDSGNDLKSPFDDENGLEKKFGSTPLFTGDEKDEFLGPRHEIPFEVPPSKGVSFSEKLEHEEEYEEKYRARAERLAEPDEKEEEKPAPEKPVKPRSPLDKYTTDEDDEDDINEILDQYSRSESNMEKLRNPQKQEQSQTKSFTDIFTKLLTKDHSDNGDGELMEDSRKQKKTHASSNVPPIERKHLSDIDIKLSDKMLQDTAQISTESAKAELEKINQLKERRDRKVKDFVLFGEETEEPEEQEPDDTPEEIEDFESLNDARSVKHHIDNQKSKLFLRLLILVVCFALTAYIATANDYSLPIVKQIGIIDKRLSPDTFLFINSLLGVIAGIVSFQTISNGISKLFTMKADCDTLSSLALVSGLCTSMISLADSNMIRGNFVHVYIPAAIGALIFNTVGKLLIISRTQRSFAHISGDTEHYALFMVEDEQTAQNFTHGTLTDFPHLAGMQKTEVITDFLKTSYESDSTDRFCKLVCPIISGAALLIALIAGFLARAEHGSIGAFCVGLSAFSACTSICSCFGMMLVVNLPMEKASKKYAEKQGAILGFDSIDEFCETNTVLIDAAQLFPAGTINLVNIKTFPDCRIDDAIIDAASLTNQSGSILKSMFYDIIVGKTEMLNPVESYLYEDSMGLGGWINNKRVLLGNRELMENHSIEGLPSIMKEQEYTGGSRIPIYLSISGQLSLMFIIELAPSFEVTNALKELERSHIGVMVRSVDSMLTVNTLSELFDVSPSLFKLIPFRYHTDYETTTEYTAKRSATLACSGRFASFAELIIGSNRLRSTISAGIAIQAAEILLGILLTLALVLLHSMTELTVTSVLLYNFVFVILYYIFQSVRKI